MMAHLAATRLPEPRTDHMLVGKQAPEASPVQLLAGSQCFLAQRKSTSRDRRDYHREEPDLFLGRRPPLYAINSGPSSLPTPNRPTSVVCLSYSQVFTQKASPSPPPNPQSQRHKNPPAHYSADPAETERKANPRRVVACPRASQEEKAFRLAATLISRSHEREGRCVGITDHRSPRHPVRARASAVPARVVH